MGLGFVRDKWAVRNDCLCRRRLEKIRRRLDDHFLVAVVVVVVVVKERFPARTRSNTG